MKNFVIALLIISLLPSCVRSFNNSTYNYYSRAREIVTPYSIYLKKTKGLGVTGIGGSMASDFKVFTIIYAGEQKHNVSTARQLYVEIKEELMARFNADTEIRPYLQNFPVTAENVDLDLTFEDQYGKREQGGNIAFVFTAKGYIFYKTYDFQREEYIEMHRETFEDAKRIVKEEQALQRANS